MGVFLSDLSLASFLEIHGKETPLPFGYMERETRDPQSSSIYKATISRQEFVRAFLNKSCILRNMVLGRVCQKNPILMQCLTDVFNFKENPQVPAITLHNFRQLCTLLAYALGGEPPKERKDQQGFSAFIRGESITFKKSMTPDKLAKRMRIYLTRTLELTFEQESQQLVLGAPAE